MTSHLPAGDEPMVTNDTGHTLARVTLLVTAEVSLVTKPVTTNIAGKGAFIVVCPFVRCQPTYAV